VKYRLVVIDIDGTLVDGYGNMAEEDKLAINRIVKSRALVCLSTGRVIEACKSIIGELNLNTPHIFYDGALICQVKSMMEIESWPVEPELVKEAVEFSRKYDIYLELYSSQHFFAEKENWSDDVHRKFFRVEPNFVSFDGIWDKERILKAEILVHNPEEAAKSRTFQDQFGKRLRFSIARSPAFPEVDFINIVNPVVSKGEALKKLANFVGVHSNEIIAIGDGLNDIPLLKEAGVSVAMGNAFPEVKATAQYVTLDIEHHGVAAAIDFFFPV
jgi:Cof subfamily protein (haloacid dehalogenase superfamily)